MPFHFPKNTHTKQAIALSVDHKPILPVEMQRIHESGGWVENCRVNGSLALSRALGDFKFKQNKKLKAERQIVTGESIMKISNEKKTSSFIDSRLQQLNCLFMLFSFLLHREQLIRMLKSMMLMRPGTLYYWQVMAFGTY